MKSFFKILILLIASLFINNTALAQSNHGYAVDILKGTGNINGIKLAYQYHMPKMQNLVGDTRFYIETSVNLWEFAHNHHS